ncbi:Uncharacterised protein [Vibrio cholerae]|nr:Uncharacterised protein [Vibrio cholerae]CSC41653.1 Uncharacterised protein [Vibrio cholerae]
MEKKPSPSIQNHNLDNFFQRVSMTIFGNHLSPISYRHYLSSDAE